MQNHIHLQEWDFIKKLVCPPGLPKQGYLKILCRLI